MSSDYPLVWSFLTCYHFGYHWEHHEYPSLPWYRLPSVRQQRQQWQFKIDAFNPEIARFTTISPLLALVVRAYLNK